jgi:hypothetical protein
MTDYQVIKNNISNGSGTSSTTSSEQNQKPPEETLRSPADSPCQSPRLKLERTAQRYSLLMRYVEWELLARTAGSSRWDFETSDRPGVTKFVGFDADTLCGEVCWRVRNLPAVITLDRIAISLKSYAQSPCVYNVLYQNSAVRGGAKIGFPWSKTQFQQICPVRVWLQQQPMSTNTNINDSINNNNNDNNTTTNIASIRQQTSGKDESLLQTEWFKPFPSLQNPIQQIKASSSGSFGGSKDLQVTLHFDFPALAKLFTTPLHFGMCRTP